MRFVPGCNCCGCTTGEARFKLFGCTPSGGSPTGITGASIVVKLGATTVATVTSAGAAFATTGTILAPGTYDVTIDYNRYAHYATTVTINSSCNQVDTTITLPTPAGMICCSVLNGKLVPATLFVTDNNGTWTCTWNTSLLRWVGCGSKVGFSTTRWDLVASNATCTATTGTVPYSINITCAGGISVGWKTVQPCSGTTWSSCVQATCNTAGTVAQPEFDSSTTGMTIPFQTAGGSYPGAAVLGNVPISGTLGSFPATVGDGGGHVVVPPVSGGVTYSE